MKNLRFLDSNDLKLAIELFDKQGYGIPTIKKALREKHRRSFCENQIKRQLAEHGFKRNAQEAYAAKREKYKEREVSHG